jgi:hypothetical protein
MIPGGVRIDEHATAGRRKAPGQRAPFDTTEKQWAGPSWRGQRQHR